MKPASVFIFALALTCLLLNACGTSSVGPKTWIDTPQDNITVPLAPIAIMAHAADIDGVDSIEFYVNGQFMKSVAAEFKGDVRLGWAEWEYTPANPGVYRIEVSAVDTAGNAGAPATSTVTISGEEIAVAPEEDLPETEPPPTEPPVPETEEPAAELVEYTPVVIAKLDANCRKGPGTAYEIYGSLLKDQQAEIVGRLENNAWFLIALVERSSNCWISASTVEVQGDLGEVSVASAPPLPQEPPPAETQPPVGDVIIPEPIEVDADPPVFASVGAGPKEIVIAGVSCTNYPNTTTVAAAIGEASGLSVVRAHWHIGGSESGQVNLVPGELGYYATIGPVSTTGTMEIYIFAQDTLGYSAQSQTFYVTVYSTCSID